MGAAGGSTRGTPPERAVLPVGADQQEARRKLEHRRARGLYVQRAGECRTIGSSDTMAGPVPHGRRDDSSPVSSCISEDRLSPESAAMGLSRAIPGHQLSTENLRT